MRSRIWIHTYIYIYMLNKKIWLVESMRFDYAWPRPTQAPQIINQGSGWWLPSTANQNLCPGSWLSWLGPAQSQSQSPVEGFHMTLGSGVALFGPQKTPLILGYFLGWFLFPQMFALKRRKGHLNLRHTHIIYNYIAGRKSEYDHQNCNKKEK